MGQIQYEAIECKKALAAEKHGGDTSQWKREIWPSPEKNRDIKTALQKDSVSASRYYRQVAVVSDSTIRSGVVWMPTAT